MGIFFFFAFCIPCLGPRIVLQFIVAGAENYTVQSQYPGAPLFLVPADADSAAPRVLRPICDAQKDNFTPFHDPSVKTMQWGGS
jgi:hypothetical protein